MQSQEMEQQHQQQQQQQQQQDEQSDEKQTYHQRNESVYSMDSFVADFPSREGDTSNSSPSPEKPRSHSYISPSSSAATTPASVQQHQHHHHRNPSFQDTIDSANNGSILFTPSNETPIPRQAPNPFFSPSYYEDSSEISDGVFPATGVAGVS